MSKPATYKVARSKDAVYIRVVGMGNMNNSATVKDFAERMGREGWKRFVIDLAECRGVDSTFMGILVSLRDGLVVVNAGAHCRKQLESVGLHRLLKIQEGQTPVPEGLALCDLPDADVDSITRLKLIMKAHQDLIAIDKANEAKFGAFLKDLAKNLGNGGAPGGGGAGR